MLREAGEQAGEHVIKKVKFEHSLEGIKLSDARKGKVYSRQMKQSVKMHRDATAHRKNKKDF